MSCERESMFIVIIIYIIFDVFYEIISNRHYFTLTVSHYFI